MNYQMFYSELGKLLYAVADANKFISKKESDELRKLVRNELIFLENSVDAFKTDTAYYAEIEFDYLDETIADPDEAFQSFMDYVEEHSAELSTKMLLAAKRAANRIADAYYHANKKEHKYLDQMEKKINGILREKHHPLI